ncbi:MAG: hypothetical protein ACKVG9_05690, partial [Rhodospirillales bacterium]
MVAITAKLCRGRIGPWLNYWALATLVLTIIFLGPVIAVFAAASGDNGGLWAHLFDTVLPRYVANTLALMLGVAVVSLLFGVSAAWAVVRYKFPGRRILE